MSLWIYMQGFLKEFIAYLLGISNWDTGSGCKSAI